MHSIEINNFDCTFFFTIQNYSCFRNGFKLYQKIDFTPPHHDNMFSVVQTQIIQQKKNFDKLWDFKFCLNTYNMICSACSYYKKNWQSLMIYVLISLSLGCNNRIHHHLKRILYMIHGTLGYKRVHRDINQWSIIISLSIHCLQI